MWTLLKEVIAVLIVIYFFSQIILPSFVPGMEYFNLHKRKKKEPPKERSNEELDELDAQATEVVEKFKDVKTKVEETENKVTSIKSKLNN